ncbi:glycosyltransferase family 2 protein [Candidatus Gracilibacteria bacterium]|nr:glycosyltransferase family 2 protein [Candidatus Gracilibacteria bacterium]
MSKKIMLSAVMLNFNCKYFPKMCVDAFRKGEMDFEYEMIAVDNASTDPISLGYLEKAAEQGLVEYVKSPTNLGFGGGNNLGAKQARGKYVLILNPDIFVETDSIQKLVDYMEAHPDVGIMGPKLIYPDGKVQDSCRRNMSFWDLVIKRTFLKKIFKKRVDTYTMEDFDHETTREVDLLVGACFILPRELYEEIGGFDERYFLFMEDFDLCKEVSKRGKKVIYYPEVGVTHNHKRLSGGSLWKLLRKRVFWIHISSAFKYFWKWR